MICCSVTCSRVIRPHWTRACDLSLNPCRGHGKMEIKHLSSRQTIALQAVPGAQHLYRDSEVLSHRLDRIAASDFVARCGVSVSAGIALLACGNGNDQPCVRR